MANIGDTSRAPGNRIYASCRRISSQHIDHAIKLTSPLTDMTVFKYVEPPPMGSAEEAKTVTTTVYAYDQSQVRQAWRGQLMGVGMMAVMHIYFKYTNPLLIQSIIPVKSALEGNLAKIYLFGKPASGELKRPWKASGFMQGGELKTDKKSIEAAERSGRGGAKEE
jgi:hypothetical protein